MDAHKRQTAAARTIQRWLRSKLKERSEWLLDTLEPRVQEEAAVSDPTRASEYLSVHECALDNGADHHLQYGPLADGPLPQNPGFGDAGGNVQDAAPFCSLESGSSSAKLLLG